MVAREKEYREVFITEGLEIYDGLSSLLIQLEKSPKEEKFLAEIFRLLHNLKANAKAIGFADIADVTHKLENAFVSIRNNKIEFKGDVVNVLIDGTDMLGTMITNINNPHPPKPEPELIRILNTLSEDSFNSSNVINNGRKRYYTAQNISLSDLIYIPIKKLDHLLNLVGELIIDRDRVLSISNEINHDALRAVANHLVRITNNIQNSVMDARLVNIGSLFNKFPRIVRDIAVVEDKSVELKIIGQEIKIDRNILQIISDSLLHLIRNAITHGIETREERKLIGKPEISQLKITAYNEKEQVIIEVTDDGKGIDIEKVKSYALSKNIYTEDKMKDMSDREILSLIFELGFTLSTEISELSGRGVGLDVVKTALDSISGKINITSEKNVGTTFSLIMPTSIAVKGALLISVNETSYAIPLIHTNFVQTISPKQLHKVGDSWIVDLKTEILPVLNLRLLFQKDNLNEEQETAFYLDKPMHYLVIVTHNNRTVGVIVDEIIRQQDIVVKNLQQPVDNSALFSGVTLLGTGEVCLVLDVPSIVRKMIAQKIMEVKE